MKLSSRIIALLAVMVLLAACGGGGGSSTSSTDDSSSGGGGGNGGGGGETGPEIQNINIAVDDITPFVNNTINFSASGLYRAPAIFADGPEMASKNITTDVTWSSNDESVLTINNRGVATTLSDGRVKVTASLDGESAEVFVDVLIEATVNPLWPTNGSNWNYYTSGSGDDIACNPALDLCLHGGERRKVEVTGHASCTNLTMTDTLQAFDWTCDDGTGTAVFTSTLKDAKNLSDLIDFDAVAFRQNSVEVTDGANPILRSRPAVWWTNPVEVNHAGGTISDAQGKVLLIKANQSLVYNINSDNAALVILPGVTMTGSATTLENAITVEGNNFVWVEGDTDCAADVACLRLYSAKYVMARNLSAANSAASRQGIYIFDSHHCEFRRVNSSNNLKYGIMHQNSTMNSFVDVTVSGNETGYFGNSVDNNTFTRFTAENNGDKGIWILISTNGNTFQDIVLQGNTGSGLFCDNCDNQLVDGALVAGNSQGIHMQSGSNNNRFSRVRSAGNSQNGMLLSSSSGNAAFDSVFAGNGLYGIRFDGNDNVLFNVTASGNVNAGVGVLGGAGHLLMGITAANNSMLGVQGTGTNLTFSDMVLENNGSGGANDGGMYVYTTDFVSFYDIVSADNAGYGVKLGSVLNGVFHDNLKVKDNTLSNCNLTSTAPAEGGVNSDCTIAGTSDAALTTTEAASASFVGKVTSNDSANASDTDGAAAYAAGLDRNFDNEFRAWGKDGSAFPNADNRGRCTSGTCRIWDWSAKSSDSVIREENTLPNDGDMTIDHTWSNASSSTFLKDAYEEHVDDNGDDDFFCEDGEICVYMPNIGGYQGHGSLISAGSFTDGTLTGITLMKYETNGR